VDDPELVREGTCPICNADVPMSGDERTGETIYCAYCQAPLKVGKLSLEEDPELTEDF
jgi:hypothetical protein